MLKVVRKITPGVNLMESKKLVEELPSVAGTKIPAEEAKKFVEELQAAGAVVKLE